jgi:23S rRNA maturation-related 3'-5' exoribonuclease YhaM
LLEAPKSFWTIGASSSAKHHPKQSNGEGGLIQYTKMLCSMAHILCRAYNIEGIPKDEILAACILHDIHKPDYMHALSTHQWMRDKIKLLKPEEVQMDSYVRIAEMIR